MCSPDRGSPWQGQSTEAPTDTASRNASSCADDYRNGQFRRRPKGPAGGQFSPEDRPDDPPVEADNLLKQATGDTSAADPDEEATPETAEPAEDGTEITLLREHFKR